MTRTIWTISEKSPGHDSQSRGLADAIARHEPADIHEATARLTAPGFIRPALRRLMGASGHPLPDWILVRTHETSFPENAPPPDLVIASGGKSALGARTIATRHNAQLVYSGEQKRFPDSWFDAIVSPVPGDARPNAIESVLIPTTVTPETVERAADEYQRPEGNLRAMVIGGSSRSHRYTDDDWRDLANGMNTISAHEGVRWLVTTSRRTGAPAERLLREALDDAAIADSVWWADKPRRVLHAFLGSADAVCVTQDSVTMVTEAVASGRPTIAVRPRDVRFPTGSFLPPYFDRLERLNLIARAQTDELASTSVPTPDERAQHDASIDTLALRVLNKLTEQKR